jgi:hypothetical protein
VQQYVNMASLGYSFARLYLLWKVIALDYCYLLKMIRKNAARQESGHTRADNHGMLPAESNW